ncbi:MULTISPECIES: response regulator transcription factor [unclassified Streptomyces]|uniref:response regulator transcription factor n=1 Tax=unclassified Streptomyces TaxID=2593676 RepID=UPI00039DBE7A|nr:MULTISPECIES: response regulator transcription factor [unclassified Streptomyces]MYX38300.1 response regulator [Streptomyces sp. SID8377]
MTRDTADLFVPLPGRRSGAREPFAPPTAVVGHPAPAAEALRVLVAESESADADSLARELTRQGFVARSTGTGTRTLQLFTEADLVLLDLDLPDMDGLQVCRAIRSVSDTPVIATSTRGAELDRVLGLQAGADDYLVKPYGIRELLARMDALMRRVRRPSPDARTVVRGPLRLDPGSREVTLEGRPVALTRKEFELLHLLVSHPDRVVTRRHLMSQVWGDSTSRQFRTVDTHVSSLRGKLGSSEWIITVRGVGFRIGHP